MNKEYTNLILTAGLILGLIFTATSYMPYFFGNTTAVSTISNILGWGSIVWALIFYGRKAAVLKDVDGAGFSYGQALGFSMLVLVLSGVIVGIGMALLFNVFAPEYYDTLINTAMEQQMAVMNSSVDPEQVKALAGGIMKNPLFMVLTMMFSMACIGFLIALVTSAIVSRKPRL